MARDTEKRDLKQETTFKNNLFSRYLLFRYSLALLFFANIYWIMILSSYHFNVIMILPVIALCLLVGAIAEQFALYGKRKAALKVTKIAFLGQIVVNMIAILLVVLPHQFANAFPIFSDDVIAKLFVIALQLIGLLISWLNLKRIEQIKNNTDKFYYRFQQAFGKKL